MADCRYFPACQRCNEVGDSWTPCTGGSDGMRCEGFEPMPDIDALLALADLLRTPELETDCGTCPLRKWCEEARDSGNRITCFECKLWHTSDAIREALGVKS